MATRVGAELFDRILTGKPMWRPGLEKFFGNSWGQTGLLSTDSSLWPIFVPFPEIFWH